MNTNTKITIEYNSKLVSSVASFDNGVRYDSWTNKPVLMNPTTTYNRKYEKSTVEIVVAMSEEELRNLIITDWKNRYYWNCLDKNIDGQYFTKEFKAFLRNKYGKEFRTTGMVVNFTETEETADTTLNF